MDSYEVKGSQFDPVEEKDEVTADEMSETLDNSSVRQVSIGPKVGQFLQIEAPDGEQFVTEIVEAHSYDGETIEYATGRIKLPYIDTPFLVFVDEIGNMIGEPTPEDGIVTWYRLTGWTPDGEKIDRGFLSREQSLILSNYLGQTARITTYANERVERIEGFAEIRETLNKMAEAGHDV